MNYYHYLVSENNIGVNTGKLNAIPADFKDYDKGPGKLRLYYKTVAGHVTDLICRALNPVEAENYVQNFLLWNKSQ